jgi:hypothetical protein
LPRVISLQVGIAYVDPALGALLSDVARAAAESVTVEAEPANGGAASASASASASLTDASDPDGTNGTSGTDGMDSGAAELDEAVETIVVLNADDVRALLVALAATRALVRDARHADDFMDGAPVAVWLLFDAWEWTVDAKTKNDIRVRGGSGWTDLLAVLDCGHLLIFFAVSTSVCSRIVIPRSAIIYHSL